MSGTSAGTGLSPLGVERDSTGSVISWKPMHPEDLAWISFRSKDRRSKLRTVGSNESLRLHPTVVEDLADAKESVAHVIEPH